MEVETRHYTAFRLLTNNSDGNGGSRYLTILHHSHEMYLTGGDGGGDGGHFGPECSKPQEEKPTTAQASFLEFWTCSGP